MKEDLKRLKKENSRLKLENKVLKELLNSNMHDNSGRKGRKIKRYSREI